VSIPRGITRDDVVAAIRDFDAGVAHPYGESARYDLIVSDRRYPPKAIVGLAGRRVNGGRFLDPVTEFSGGEAGANRVLRALGPGT
jgi:5-methylcytosine-specific restriction enzyme A